jgi:hypothetical protein
MSGRGHYGRNGVLLIGQAPQRYATVYVERRSSSTGAWILGTLAVGGALLWTRHQSSQIEQLYKTSGLPYQGFVGSLRQSARGLVARVKPSSSTGAKKSED